jgi:hypothetical protein
MLNSALVILIIDNGTTPNCSTWPAVVLFSTVAGF